MAKGRNTTVISLRLPDEVVDNLKIKAQKQGLSLSDYLKQDQLFHLPPVETEVQCASIETSVKQNEVKRAPVVRLVNPGELVGKIRNRHGDIIAEADWEYFKKHPDKNCPCGSKIPY